MTQSTLSRDLRELRLARIPDGQRRVPATPFPTAATEETTPQLEQLLPQLLMRVEAVQVLVVARTVPSGAQPVAAALDGAGWTDVLGTIAGDDTVLIICRSAHRRANAWCATQGGCLRDRPPRIGMHLALLVSSLHYATASHRP